MQSQLTGGSRAADAMRDGTSDPRSRRYLPVARIVWQTEGTAAPQNSQALLGNGTGLCRMKHDGAAPGMLVDFGRELHGGIRLENDLAAAHAPVRLRVRFGESVSEAMGTPNQDHAIHDMVCDIPWYGSAELGNTGFRFVRIDLVEPGTELVLKHFHAVALNHDIEYKGSFRCDDERLNQIWEVGAYTVHQCMQEMLWDGIKRDRLVWIGDMHPETTVISTVFGHHDIVPKSLDFARDNAPLPGWMNGIGSYSLWWILIQRDWYLHHGDIAYLLRQKSYLLELLAWLQTQIGPDGAEALEGHRFLDWPSSEDPIAIHAGLQALFAMALRAGAELCSVLGEKASAAACEDALARLHKHVPDAKASKQASALLALAGLSDPATVNREVLAANPLSGLSTFYGYYVLQARASAGDYSGCLDVIRNYWGTMLDFGATTFWEDFDLAWTENAGPIDELVAPGKKDLHADFGDYCYKGLRHSLCHGWAAGPTAWLSEHILGFKPLEPGCHVLRVAPHLAGLRYAEGTFPTPAGTVRVRHEADGATGVRSQIEAPSGIRIVRG